MITPKDKRLWTEINLSGISAAALNETAFVGGTIFNHPLTMVENSQSLRYFAPMGKSGIASISHILICQTSTTIGRPKN